MSDQIAPQTHRALLAYQGALGCLEENRLLEAMVEVRRSLECDPEFFDGHFLKAHIHRLLGQYQEAIPILDYCLTFLSEDVDVLREAAEVTLLAGEEKASLKYYERLHDLDPEDDGVCARIVAIAFRLGGVRLALKRVKQCLEEFPEWAPGYISLGNLLEEAGKREQAAEAYQRALHLVPDHRGARRNLERLYQGQPFEKGHYEYAYGELFLVETTRLSRDGFAARAVRILENWRPKFPGDLDFLVVLAKTSFQIGRYRSALSAIQEIPLNRRAADLLSLEARAMRCLGDHQGAASRYERLCKQRPNSPELWLEYLDALSKSSKPAKAVPAVEEAVSRLPLDADLWFEAARIRKRYVNSKQCVAALESVIGLRPNHPQALYALGTEKLLSGDAAGAVPALSALTSTNRDHLEGWRHLAIAYTRLKEWRKAHASWSAVIRLAPSDSQAIGNLDKLEKLLSSPATLIRAAGIRRIGSA